MSSDMFEKTGIPKRICPVIFLLDTSGSMAGAPIGAVDTAMEGILPELVTMNAGNSDVEIQIAVMTFDFDAKWITGEGLVSPNDYIWRPLNAGGATSMGAAFDKLTKALSTKEGGFMRRASGQVAPVFFLLSDGEPTDDWEYALNILKEKAWYKVAIRVAVGYSDNYNEAVLREFTGTKETVFKARTPKELTSLIKFTAITSSRVASQGSAISTPHDAENAIDDNTAVLVDEINQRGGLAAMDPDDGFDD